MRFIKFLFLSVVSVGVSKAFFNSSVLATLCVFCGLNYIVVTSSEEYIAQKRPLTLIYVIATVICLISVLLVVIGKFFLHMDEMTIAGAALFAVTITGLSMNLICNLWKYLSIKLRKNQ